MHSQTTTLKKRKTIIESSRKTARSMLRSLSVRLIVPPSKTRISGLKPLFLEPKKHFR